MSTEHTTAAESRSGGYALPPGQRDPRPANGSLVGLVTPARSPAPGPAPGTEATPGPLTPDRLLLRLRHEPPEPGWRRWAYRASGGAWRPSEASTAARQRQLREQATAPLPDRTRFVAVLSRKGGVGKTTTATLLGMTLAAMRPDRIVALDANPDRGTLADRTARQTTATVWDVVADADDVSTYTQMSHLVNRDPSRLDVIASEADPGKARAFRETDYISVSELLTRYYSIVITDCGTDFTHEVVPAVLAYADAVVVVAGGSVDEVMLADETLDMISALGHPALAEQAVVAVRSPRHSPVNMNEVVRHFAGRARAVVRIPRDRHLAEGALIQLDRLSPATRRAGVELAATVVAGVGGGPRGAPPR